LASNEARAARPSPPSPCLRHRPDGERRAKLNRFDINENLTWSIRTSDLYLKGICWGASTIYGWSYNANLQGSNPAMGQIKRYAWKDFNGALKTSQTVSVRPNILPVQNLGFQTIEHVNGRPGTFAFGA
jgi:hypothetical protein